MIWSKEFRKSSPSSNQQPIHQIQDLTMKQIRATCAEHDQMRQSLPSKLEWRPNIHFSNDSHAYLLEILNLEFLHNDFILYSVLIKRTGEHKDKLIQAARKMLSTLVSWVSARAPSMLTSFRSSWDVRFLPFFFFFFFLLHEGLWLTYRLALLHRPPMCRRLSAGTPPTLSTKTSPTHAL